MGALQDLGEQVKQLKIHLDESAVEQINCVKDRIILQCTALEHTSLEGIILQCTGLEHTSLEGLDGTQSRPKRYDFGLGVCMCAHCGVVCANRGYQSCNQNTCQKCFVEKHSHCV